MQIENFEFSTVFHDPDNVVRHFIHGIQPVPEGVGRPVLEGSRGIARNFVENGERVYQAYSLHERILIMRRPECEENCSLAEVAS